MSVVVTLTMAELFQAAMAGCVRRITSIKKGLNANVHASTSDWATDINGAGAEMAYAKHMGLFWDAGVNTFKAPDVGVVQIRSTVHKNGNLLFRPNDSISEQFILIITDAPRYTIVGWTLGEDAKVDEFYRAGERGMSGAWWVPQNRLIPFVEIGA